MAALQTADPIQQALEYMRYQGAKSFDDIIALMDRTADEWLSLLDGMSDDQASFAPGEEWSSKDVLGHLISANRGINQQIAEMAGVDSPRQSARVKGMGEISPDLAGLTIDALRSEVRDCFAETNRLASDLQASDRLDQSFPHPLFGPLSLKEWFAFHRVHARDHIGQVETNKAAAGYPSS